MPHLDVPQFLGLLVLLLGAAKLFGALARRIGQPAVLGELVAGVVVGASVLGLVDLQDKHDPRNDALHLLAEIGVVILLFEIGLETDLGKLLKVGGPSALVALVGVALPFALGYGVCATLGLGMMVSVVAGAALTATSVGITARVLSDLGRLQEPESQIVLGAAVLDDVIGLIILTVVAGLAGGEGATALGVLRIAAVAFGFLITTLLLGSYLVPPLFHWFARADLPGTPTMQAVVLAFGLAWLATRPARRSSSAPSRRACCWGGRRSATPSSAASRTWVTCSSRCSSSPSVPRWTFASSTRPTPPTGRRCRSAAC
jgi:Kef-type K+ transport system membrane component KefB